jgi:hypothetical protein
MVIVICYNIAEIAMLLLSNLKLDEKNHGTDCKDNSTQKISTNQLVVF